MFTKQITGFLRSLLKNKLIYINCDVNICNCFSNFSNCAQLCTLFAAPHQLPLPKVTRLLPDEKIDASLTMLCLRDFSNWSLPPRNCWCEKTLIATMTGTTTAIALVCRSLYAAFIFVWWNIYTYGRFGMPTKGGVTRFSGFVVPAGLISTERL